VRENPQTLLKANLGAAVVEKRTKANSRNVGVAARHGIFEKTIELIFCRITTGWS
jgi:hypothetical protein